jgi:hypothetical protein
MSTENKNEKWKTFSAGGTPLECAGIFSEENFYVCSVPLCVKSFPFSRRAEQI